ncbi:hypothetical protein [Aquitalea pelogenes]|uniref:hypothetical protein n=1 Tax=Aquitalea pelogenes TaxID=1293573 RepID=UPI0035AF630A
MWEEDYIKKINDARLAHSEFKLNHSRQQIAEMDQREKDNKTAAEIIELKNKVKEYEDLLSRPMKDIAQKHSGFKKTYDMQQQMLAEWIMGQKAYRETAMQLGMALNMTPEQVQKLAAPNYTAVLENRTQHGNDASSSPTLATHAEAILAIRRKQGKA